MKIKRLSEKNIDDIIELNRYCFQMLSDKHLQSLKDDLIKPGEYIGLFVNEKMQAGVWLRPFKMRYENEVISMYGVANVVSRPEARGKGYVKTLLLKAKDIMDDKCLFSFLAPFSYEFYEKFNWRWALDYMEIKLSMSALKSFKDQGTFKKVEPTYSNELILDDLYERFMLYNASLIRDDRLWGVKTGRYSDFPNRHIVILYDGDQPIGYMIYDLTDGKFYVEEIVSSLVNRKKFFKYIYGHNMQANQVIIKLPKDDLILHQLDNPKHDMGIVPYMAVLAMDAKKILGYMRGCGDFKIGIQNGSILEAYHVVASDYRNQVVETNSPDFICDIRIFTELAMRHISFSEALSLDQISLLTSVDEENLDKFFYKKTSFINDFF